MDEAALATTPLWLKIATHGAALVGGIIIAELVKPLCKHFVFVPQFRRWNERIREKDLSDSFTQTEFYIGQTKHVIGRHIKVRIFNKTSQPVVIRKAYVYSGAFAGNGKIELPYDTIEKISEDLVTPVKNGHKIAEHSFGTWLLPFKPELYEPPLIASFYKIEYEYSADNKYIQLGTFTHVSKELFNHSMQFWRDDENIPPKHYKNIKNPSKI